MTGIGLGSSDSPAMVVLAGHNPRFSGRAAFSVGTTEVRVVQQIGGLFLGGKRMVFSSLDRSSGLPRDSEPGSGYRPQFSILVTARLSLGYFFSSTKHCLQNAPFWIPFTSFECTSVKSIGHPLVVL